MPVHWGVPQKTKVATLQQRILNELHTLSAVHQRLEERLGRLSDGQRDATDSVQGLRQQVASMSASLSTAGIQVGLEVEATASPSQHFPAQASPMIVVPSWPHMGNMSPIGEQENLRGSNEQPQSQQHRELTLPRLDFNEDLDSQANSTHQQDHDRFCQFFDNLCICTIFLHTIFLGIQVHVTGVTRHTEPWWCFWIDVGFNLWFLLELLLRLCCRGIREYCCGPERSWNRFDAFLVLACTAQRLFDSRLNLLGGHMANLNVIRFLRILRILRVVRVLRFLRGLQLIAGSILHSLSNVFMVFLLLFGILYLAALVVTQISTEYIKRALPGDPLAERLESRFGTIFTSIYTLYQMITGGVNWGTATDPLLDLHWVYAFFMCIFIGFTILGVLNIVTAIFVNDAVEAVQNAREERVQAEIQEEEKMLAQLHRVFDDIDVDKSGSLSPKEFHRFLSKPQTKAFLRSIGMEWQDARVLFHVLDEDGNKEITREEFVNGCIRHRGNARGVDMWRLRSQNKQLMRRLDDFMHYVEQEFSQQRQLNQKSLGHLEEAMKPNASALPISLAQQRQVHKFIACSCIPRL